jgi:hypothetical protein
MSNEMEAPRQLFPVLQGRGEVGRTNRDADNRRHRRVDILDALKEARAVYPGFTALQTLRRGSELLRAAVTGASYQGSPSF